MKLLILLGLVALTKARVIADDNENCNGVIVNGINHEKQILKENVDKPYQLALDYDTNTLYFSYTATDGSVFRSAYINLKTNEFGTIKGIRGGFANAVDPKTHKIYIGGSDGIYVVNENSQTAVKTDITDLNIWQVFVKDDVYFTSYPDENAYVYKDGETKIVPEIGDAKAMLLAVDKNHDIYYYNSSGVFHYNKADGTTKNIGDNTVNGFTHDSNDNIFFSTPTGVYSVKDNSVTKVVGINNIYGAAIAADGSIIYAADNSIVKLKSTGHECSTELEVLHL